MSSKPGVLEQQTTSDAIEVRTRSGGSVKRGSARILAMFALLGILALSLDAFINAGLRKLNTGEMGVWNQIINGTINADIIISGSSRAMTHYDPIILQQGTGLSAFNIGLNGSQSDMQVARLKTYLEHNRKPKIIIHNLDAFSFQVTHGGVFNPGQYIPYLQEEHIFRSLEKINPDIWKSRRLPLYGYAVEDLRFTWLLSVPGWAKYEGTDSYIRGYKPRQANWTEEFEQFRTANPNGFRVPVEPAGIAEIEDLLATCKQQNIELIFVYSPEYKGVQQLTLNREDIFKRFAEMSRRYGVKLFDFSDSPIAVQKDYFYNSQHLNVAGATEFSRALTTALNTELSVTSPTKALQ